MPSSPPAPSRVLMTADTVGGVWTYALELCAGLQRHGVQVALCTMGRALSPDQWDEVSTLPNVEVHESTFRLEWMDDPWEDVRRSNAWLLDVAARFHPEVVHLNTFSHGVLPFEAPVLVVGHSCVLSWFEAVKGEPAPPSWDRYREAVGNGLRAARRVVAPSRAMLEALEKHYGPLPPGSVIPNARARFPVHACDEKSPFILSAGRVWDEGKNVALLTRIAHALPWPVRVAGEDQHPSGGRGAQLGHVVPLGRLSSLALAEQMAQAAIYALPARYEPFGLSALEAAQSGCALVLGDIPSLREVWGDAALFVAPDDADGWTETLTRLTEDADLRETLSRRARQRASRYDPSLFVGAYLEAYARLT